MSSIALLSQIPLTIRVATMADVPFIDALQKTQREALGYWPLKQIEEHVGEGYVLIAEEVRDRTSEVRDQMSEVERRDSTLTRPHPGPLPGGEGERRLGYLISRDRYLKRDELGVIYQMNVVPGAQRKCVAASLLREAFVRSAYGCRLYCCWCAQDLVAANEFWEAMGFVPLAFRAGSDRKKRVHIFWQKRIVEGDETTPWWYPFKTDSGAIRADRMVFPIPADVNWRDVRAVEVPMVKGERLQISDLRIADASVKTLSSPKSQIQNLKSMNGPGPGKVGILIGGRIKYVMRPGFVATPDEKTVAPNVPLPAVAKKRKRVPKPKKLPAEIDPAFLRRVRELRDRYLEHINSDDVLLISHAKYEVFKLAPEASVSKQTLALPAPAHT